jgi:hypothetical protein
VEWALQVVPGSFEQPIDVSLLREVVMMVGEKQKYKCCGPCEEEYGEWPPCREGQLCWGPLIEAEEKLAEKDKEIERLNTIIDDLKLKSVDDDYTY